MVFQWQLHRYNPPFCEKHRRGYENEGCLRIEFKPHKNKRLPAASCTETSWIATIFLKSDRFIQPDSRRVLCYDRQLYLQVSRLLRAFDARKRKSLPDAAPPVGFFQWRYRSPHDGESFPCHQSDQCPLFRQSCRQRTPQFRWHFCFRCAPSKILLPLGR